MKINTDSQVLTQLVELTDLFPATDLGGSWGEGAYRATSIHASRVWHSDTSIKALRENLLSFATLMAAASDVSA